MSGVEVARDDDWYVGVEGLRDRRFKVGPLVAVVGAPVNGTNQKVSVGGGGGAFELDLSPEEVGRRGEVWTRLCGAEVGITEDSDTSTRLVAVCDGGWGGVCDVVIELWFVRVVGFFCF